MEIPFSCRYLLETDLMRDILQITEPLSLRSNSANLVSESSEAVCP